MSYIWANSPAPGAFYSCSRKLQTSVRLFSSSSLCSCCSQSTIQAMNPIQKLNTATRSPRWRCLEEKRLVFLITIVMFNVGEVTAAITPKLQWLLPLIFGKWGAKRIGLLDIHEGSESLKHVHTSGRMGKRAKLKWLQAAKQSLDCFYRKQDKTGSQPSWSVPTMTTEPQNGSIK